MNRPAMVVALTGLLLAGSRCCAGEGNLLKNPSFALDTAAKPKTYTGWELEPGK